MGGIEIMRITNNASSARSRLVSQAKMKARSKTGRSTSSKLSSNNVNSILNALNKKSSVSSKNKTTNQTSETKLKINYTAIKNAANGLQGHAAKLLSTKEDSLFGMAIPETTKDVTTKDTTTKDTTTKDTTTNATTQPTEAELLKGKENVVKEITGFIEDYNTMISKMSSMNNSLNNIYIKQFKNCVADNRVALKALGITQAANGTLSVNQKTLNAADVSKMQKVFGTKNSFADKVTTRSDNVELNAENKLEEYNKSNHSSSYNRYGKNYTNSSIESKYNVKG